MTIVYETASGESARTAEEILSFCMLAFDEFSPDYLTSRLAHVDGPALVTARFEDGSLAGFKLGYRRGSSLFYSWLGGVHPDARRQGVAGELMRRQHEWVKAQGYTEIETRTRAVNSAMLMVNLRSGFLIRGFEVDAKGRPVVIQRKTL
jgi:predicted GNAT superfamily acetyltransferase